MTYVGDGEKKTQKKEKDLDFFSKKTVNYNSGISTLRSSLVYASFRNLPSAKQYK